MGFGFEDKNGYEWGLFGGGTLKKAYLVLSLCVCRNSNGGTQSDVGREV